MSCRIPPLIQVRIDLIGHFDQQIGPILLELEQWGMCFSPIGGFTLIPGYLKDQDTNGKFLFFFKLFILKEIKHSIY